MARGSYVAMIALAFLLGGCRSDEYRAIKAFCEAYEECQPSNFEADYEDSKDCIKETQSTLEQAEEDNGAACADAFGAAIECAADVQADTCDFLAVVAECREEVVAALEECPELDLESLDLGGL